MQTTHTQAIPQTTRWLVVVAAAMLIAVWPIPYTMALRHLLYFIGLLACAAAWYKIGPLPLLQKRAWPVWVTLCFFAWLVFHYFFLSTNREEQLYELSGDWLRAIYASVLGLTVGYLLTQDQGADSKSAEQKQSLCFAFGLSGTLIIYLGWYGDHVVATHQWMHQNFWQYSYLEKPAIVVFGTVLIPVVLLKVLDSLVDKASRAWLGVAGFVLCALSFAYYTSNTKNGFLALAVTLLVFTAIVAFTKRAGLKLSRTTWSLSLVFLLIAGYFTKIHVEQNPAWQTMWADVQTSIQLEAHENWKNRDEHPLPKNANGIEVNPSTYERTAWATAGLILIRENPLGYGLINHSFGALARQKWADFYPPNGKNRGATHSGWIDLTLGLGLPGLLLLWIPLVGATYLAWGSTGFWQRYVVFTTPVLMFIYMVTEVSTGHFIEFLLFYIAFCAGLGLLPHEPSARAMPSD